MAIFVILSVVQVGLALSTLRLSGKLPYHFLALPLAQLSFYGGTFYIKKRPVRVGVVITGLVATLAVLALATFDTMQMSSNFRQ